jgi:hypothetical protein
MRAFALALITVLLPATAAAETWCWAPDVTAPRSSWSCVYDREQCRALVRLRHAGACRHGGSGTLGRSDREETE